jgi:hypothetical protein
MADDSKKSLARERLYCMLAFRESAGRADSQEKKRIIRHAFGYPCRPEPMNRLIEWFIRE